MELRTFLLCFMFAQPSGSAFRHSETVGGESSSGADVHEKECDEVGQEGEREQALKVKSQDATTEAASGVDSSSSSASSSTENGEAAEEEEDEEEEQEEQEEEEEVALSTKDSKISL